MPERDEDRVVAADGSEGVFGRGGVEGAGDVRRPRVFLFFGQRLLTLGPSINGHRPQFGERERIDPAEFLGRPMLRHLR